jgi:hypothetical protein
MARIRISTTVDADSLAAARGLGLGNDSTTLDAALMSLLAANRAAETDRAYAAYDDRPIDELDEWGDIAAFRESIGRVRKRSTRRAS